MLATLVQDEDHSVTIVEREDILQSNVKIKPRARPLVVTIVASPDTQRRSAVKNNETRPSRKVRVRASSRRKAKDEMIEEDEAEDYKHTPLKRRLRRTWWKTAKRTCGSWPWLMRKTRTW